VINYLDSIDINGNPRIYQEVDKRIDIGAFEYQDTLPNRRPVLIKKRDQRVMKEQIGNFKLYYFDADTNDELSFIVTCKDTGIAVQIVNITDSCLDIQVTPEQSIAVKETYLNVEINDNAGQSNSILYDSVKLIISDQFEGIVNTYVTLSGTVKIIGDIIVEKNGILDILPGTNMQFQGPYKIEVMGKINMKGTPDKRIVFTCADTSTYEKFGQTFKRGWGGIIFNNINTQDTVFADNCIFRNTGMDSVAYVLDGIGTIVIENSKNIYFNNCRFFNNYTYNSDNNSGLYIDNSENIKISGSSFTSCYSLDVLGAYVYATNSEFKISGCRFFDTNIKENEYNKHCIYSTDSKCTIDKSLFYNNYFSYGYVIATVRGQFSISESEIRNNDAGGLNIASDTALILSNKIINNKRAIEIRATPSKIINNIIAYNKLYCNCSNLYGVAIDMFGAEKSIVANNTIVNNFQDSFGNAVYSSYSSPIIVNNIFWGNNREGFGWYNGADIGFEDPVVKNNIDVDPQFQLNDSLDFHLLNSSPCINTGIQDIDGYDIPEFDIEGNYRIDTIYGLIDIGAYEYAGDDVIIDEPVSGTLDNVIQKNNEIKLYPNPTGNFINLSNIRDKSIYKIYTIEGKLVGAGIIEKGKIKVKDLGKGTYYLLLFSDNYIYRNVFIKM
jgi:hypothetical protein